MENKHVGYLLIGIAIFLIFIVLLFKNALIDIVSTSCDHGETCPMYDTIDKQTYLALGIVGILIIFSLILIFTKPKERIIFKKIRKKRKKIDKQNLDKKEKQIIDILEKENGTIFQAELMERIEIGKVGITRLLDKLEAKQLIERKRRGMNNIVILKN